MSARRILVVGSGQRVRETALPVLTRATDTWQLEGVVSRKPKTLDVAGVQHAVTPLAELDSARLASVDLIYLVVSKPAVPRVLAQLVALGAGGTDLLIETPVLLTKHLGHLGLLERFRSAWVSEDCSTLPCWDPVFQLTGGAPVSHAEFERSAYAYHGVAMARTLLGGGPVRAGRRRRTANGREWTLDFAGGRAHVLDPRDYAVGRLRLTTPAGVVADGPDAPAGTLPFRACLDHGRCTGFRAGDARSSLDDAERELLGTPGEGAGITAWMDGMKRVGFLRLLRSIAATNTAYTTRDAVEDSVVDYHLERLGHYRANPLTTPDRPLARGLYGLLTRVAGR